MLQFLTPVWLFAIAAVAVPVAIHLWNIRPGKVLKVGSISLIDAASRKSSRSFKLLDIPLFVLRCLLLILLALLLAVPLWHKKLEISKAKGWILVPKEALQTSYQKFRSPIDSLISAGYEFHYYNTGFPRTDLKQTLLNAKDSLINLDTRQPDYWNLARQLDTTITSTLPVYIFTPDQSGYFTGIKPHVALNLHWQTYIPADSTITWIERAWFNTNNTVRVIQANSNPSGTNYSYANIEAGDQPNSPYTVNVKNGQATIALKTGNQQPLNIDTATMLIAIYTDNNTGDAAYLKAALQTDVQFMQRKNSIRQYNNPATIPANLTWLFWLSDKAIPSGLIQQSRRILMYERGKLISKSSWLNNNGNYVVALQQAQKIALFKTTEAPANNNYHTLWRDGFGNPVLSEQKQGESNIYHFYSRFNPTWNDLVWSDEFPSWMMKLINGDQPPMLAKNDKRVLDQAQLMPYNAGATHTVAIKTKGVVSIANYCWFLLALLFLAERWLANRTPNTTING